MNFVKRALLVMKSKKGRILLLLCIFSAILIFILAGLTIQSAALKSIENAQESAGATATLQANRENMRSMGRPDENSEENRPSFEEVTVLLEDVEEIAELDNVTSYNVSVSSSAGVTDDFAAVTSSEEETDTEEATESQNNDRMPPGGMGGEGLPSFGPGNAQGDFMISGVLCNEFSEETATLLEGEGLKSEDKDTNNAIIEESLAELNDLEVGDVFEISNPTDETTTYKMTVKGIYQTNQVSSGMGMNFSFMNPQNTIYTSYTFANTLKGSDYQGTADSASFVLSNPKELTTFVEAGNKLIDTETYELQTNDQQYQAMMTPIQNISAFANKIVWLVSMAGAIILALVVMLMTRERRYEMGVLISLGESRLKVLGQLFIELFVVLCASLVIAGVSGTYVGNVVGNQLLEQETTSTASANDGSQQMPSGGPMGDMQMPDGVDFGGGRGGFPGMGGERNPFKQSEEIKELDITLTPVEIVKLGGLGLLIVFAAVACVSISIVRLQPKEILLG